jgi:hypothetical protein
MSKHKMLVYAITANCDCEVNDALGKYWETTSIACLALFGDYDAAHEYWKRLMTLQQPESVTEMAWTTWSLNEPNIDGIDGEFKVAKWTSDGKKDGEVMWDKEGLEYNFGINSQSYVDTIWIGIGKLSVIDEDRRRVICHSYEIISSGKTREIAEKNTDEYNPQEGNVLYGYRVKQVSLNSKPDLLN